MKVFHCNFEGHYPVGAAAVVVAENNIHAAQLLNVELEKERLKPVIAQDMIELDTDGPRAVVLCNGDY